LLSKAAQRLITELRQKVQAHVGRLSVSFHDSNKTGVLVSRIMSDVEGVRNLIGTGLVDLVGGLVTAGIALVALFRISTLMTGLAFGFLLCFGLALKKAFQTIRPIFRERGKITAEVTGRLSESLGGIRVVKGYHAEDREDEQGDAGQGDQRRPGAAADLRLVLERLRNLERMLDRMDDLLRLLLQMSHGYGLPV